MRNEVVVAASAIVSRRLAIFAPMTVQTYVASRPDLLPPHLQRCCKNRMSHAHSFSCMNVRYHAFFFFFVNDNIRSSCLPSQYCTAVATVAWSLASNAPAPLSQCPYVSSLTLLRTFFVTALYSHCVFFEVVTDVICNSVLYTNSSMANVLCAYVSWMNTAAIYLVTE